jgi:hypothetical protein
VQKTQPLQPMLFRGFKIVVGKIVCFVTLLGLSANIAFSSFSFANTPIPFNKKATQLSRQSGIKQLKTDPSIYLFDMEEDEEDVEDAETSECHHQSFFATYPLFIDTTLRLKSISHSPHYPIIAHHIPRWLFVRHLII